MFEYALPAGMALPFVALTLAVAAMDVSLLVYAAPGELRRRTAARGVVVALAWLGLHAAIASSGALSSAKLPPPMLFYLLAVIATAVAVAGSSVGRRLAALPIHLLVLSQIFRLPLELWLHRLYELGGLPVQMTWSGNNLDVWTALLALPVGLLAWWGRAPRWLLWGWNVLGALLLVNVVTVALLSTPMPFRQFTEGPAVLLPFHAPSNWIVNVHVWTALVAHLVVFRKLWSPRVS